ncbi:hypothetical protein [Streptomyces sp. NPDC091278]|uniref:hypothetical protein n=1 Tax=Streptomyces sp. NPDC091278 TaxID=3155301 RepID=UPI00344DA657
MLVLQYGMLYRSVDVTNLLVKQVRIDHDGIFVHTMLTKTRRKGIGFWRFIRDRPDLQVVTRVRAWLADLRELNEPSDTEQNPADGTPAYRPNAPLLRAITTKGELTRRKNARKRGLFLSGRTVNDVVKARSKNIGLSEINGLKVTSHSLRAGPNTDLVDAEVPLEERNRAGDWSPGSTLSDDVYNRPDGSINISKHDPFDAIPIYDPLADPHPAGGPSPGPAAA